MPTCPIRTALWLHALASSRRGAFVPPDLIAAAARLLDGRHERRRS